MFCPLVTHGKGGIVTPAQKAGKAAKRVGTRRRLGGSGPPPNRKPQITTAKSRSKKLRMKRIGIRNKLRTRRDQPRDVMCIDIREGQCATLKRAVRGNAQLH